MDFNEQIQKKINQKTKPLGALGKLEELALQVATIQNTLNPSINYPAMVVFAADHGLAESGVSAFPKEVTAQMVLNFVGGGAAINVFCRQNGIELKVVDAGVDTDFPEGLPVINAKISKGTNNMLNGPAMSAEQCDQAMQKGREIVREIHAAGSNCIGFGEMGIGNTSSASLLMHKLCELPIEECVGRGTGHDKAGLAQKLDLLKQVLDKNKVQDDPISTLACFGGFEIAMIVGAVLEAANLKMIILVDGFIITAAILVAGKLQPKVLENCIFCHQSDEKGHKLMLGHLGVSPVLNLGMRLGEGSGVAVTYPIVKAAVNFLNEMSSFADAGVSEAN